MPIKSKYFLLFIILFSTIIISGCSTILFGPSGSIEVTTNPSGAKIFLDSKDTGKITPYTLKNVSAGNHIIEVTLSDMKCTKIAEVKSYQATNINIEFYSQITLDKINVLPPTTNITLSLGNTVTISSVTAYYSDYSSANIPLTNCTYSSNDACATVNSSGNITGISAGAAIITVSYTEGGITKTDTVLVYIRNTPTDTPITPPVQDNIVVYRALLVGVGDYLYFPDAYGNIDLKGPPYNVDKMHQILEQCRFDSSDTEFSIINELIVNATKTAILDRIASTFSGADDNDISYFYFSGHGSSDTSTSYICPFDTDTVDTSSIISINELETELSKIPGTKVVILDSCHSGGFIGKGKGKITISKEEMVSFNDEIINVFSQAQSKGLLTTNQYKVLTACQKNQTSTDLSPVVPGAFDPYGLFTKVLCNGCGYDSYTHPYPADGNSNGKITLHEAYTYTYGMVNAIATELNELYGWDIDQDTQVYPLNSDFIIIEE